MRKILLVTSVLLLAAVATAIAKDVYYCPMHPSYTSDRKGTCPICNMSLVLAKPGGAQSVSVHPPVESHGVVDLTAHQRQMIGVQTASVENKKIFRTVRSYGRVSRDPRWVIAEIFEYERPFLFQQESPLVGLQHPVTVEAPAWPGRKFQGKVRLLDRDIDPMTRTTRARVQLNSWYRELKPDMSVNALIRIDLGSSLVVPISAVLDTGERQIVFVDRKDGTIEPRVVVVGERGDEEYQVVEGLHEGERVVISGNFMVDSESRLKAVFANSSRAGGHDHGQ